MPKNKAQRIFPSSEAFKMIRKLLAFTMSLTLILSGCGQGTTSTPPGNGNANTTPPPAPPTPTTASTAIKHVVVIFGENISFDHYFGTYPNAANTGGTTFTAASGPPTNINNYLSNPSLFNCQSEPQLRQRRLSIEPFPPRSKSGRHRRPGPQLRTRAGRLR